MSEPTRILLIGSTSLLNPAQLSERIAEIESGGLVMKSAYETGGVLYGIFRQRSSYDPWNGPPANPFEPQRKTYIE